MNIHIYTFGVPKLVLCIQVMIFLFQCAIRVFQKVSERVLFFWSWGTFNFRFNRVGMDDILPPERMSSVQALMHTYHCMYP